MKSYTISTTLFGTLTNNSSTANISLGAQLINDNIRYLIQKFYLGEDSKTDVTVASQQAYNLPYNYKRLTNVTITVGSYKWTPKEISSRDEWNRLNMTTVTSNTVEYYHLYDKQIHFYPIPASSSNTITYYYKVRVRDLSVADYTTGTVAITTGTKVITGSETTFVADMVGRWLQVTAPTGDQEWYKITSFTSTTVLGIESNYNGATVSGGTYTIGEMSIIPEDFQDLPVLYAVRQYYSSRVKDRAVYEMYKNMYDERYKMMEDELGGKSDNSVVLDSGIYEEEQVNPNYLLTL
jgi:hypothetical protein